MGGGNASPVDHGCIAWMRRARGPQETVSQAGCWTDIVHPVCRFLTGAHAGLNTALLLADLGPADLGQVKVWLDTRGP